MKMRKILTSVVLTAVLLCALCVPMLAADATATVYVTIVNGSPVVTQEAITVTDVDKDGALTINDALWLAHDAKYTGGVAAGYATATGDYGLYITKLWGVANGGSYGYYLNNTSASNLTDTVKSGDYLTAYAYTDTTNFSDTYCYFGANTLEAYQGLAFTLTLSAAAYDESWNPIVKPVEGASILIDGVDSGLKTGADGKVEITIDTAKTCVITATSASATLVTPVCTVTVNEANAVTAPNTGVETDGTLWVLAGMIVLAGGLVAVRRLGYEK